VQHLLVFVLLFCGLSALLPLFASPPVINITYDGKMLSGWQKEAGHFPKFVKRSSRPETFSDELTKEELNYSAVVRVYFVSELKLGEVAEMVNTPRFDSVDWARKKASMFGLPGTEIQYTGKGKSAEKYFYIPFGRDFLCVEYIVNLTVNTVGKPLPLKQIWEIERTAQKAMNARAEILKKSLIAECETILRGLKYHGSAVITGTHETGQGEEGEGESTPWRTAAGTAAAALAAAAAAILAVARTGSGALAVARSAAADKKSKDKKLDPNKPAGYILQLSTRQIFINSGETGQLSAAVWTVTASGSYTLATGARISFALVADSRVKLSSYAGKAKVTTTITAGQESCSEILQVNASIDGMEYQSQVTIEVLAEQLHLRTDPDNRRSLVVDGVDGLWIMACVADEARQNIRNLPIRFIPLGQSGNWLDLSEPHVTEGWTMVYVRAVDPAAVRGQRSILPDNFLIEVSCPGVEDIRTQKVSLTALPLPEMEITPEKLEFSVNSKGEGVIDVSITGDASQPWQFSACFAEGDEPNAMVKVENQGNTTARVLIYPAYNDISAEDFKSSSVLKIIAEHSGCADLERHARISIFREGLFVDVKGQNEQGAFIVAADGSGTATQIDFRVFVYDSTKNCMISDPKMAAKLDFSLQEADSSTVANALHFGKFSCTCTGIKSGNIPFASYSLRVEKTIPTDGRQIPGTFLVSVPGQSGEEFTTTLHILLRTSALGVGGQNWQIELNRCELIISEYVPAEYWQKMQGLLDKRKMVLGAEGLYELRRKIWNITSQLVLAQGERAYENLAIWENRCLVLCEWVEWGSDLAFESIATATYGTAGGIAAKLVKDVIKSSLVSYSEGKSADEWFYEYIKIELGIYKDCSLEYICNIYEKEPAKCYAIFIGCTFLSNLWKGDSLWDAAKGAALAAANRKIGGWIVKKLVKSPRFTDFFDTKPPKDKAVFWSGAAAREIAGKKGSPLGYCEGGKWGEEALSDLGLEWNDAKAAWESLSRRYAQQASGKVQVYLPTKTKPDSIFNRVEYPELIKNKNVSSIEIFVQKGGDWVLQTVVQGRGGNA